MAHQTSIAQWLAGKRQTFDLKILELRWGKSLATPIYDFEASITWNGKIITGRGTDTDEGIALEKACAEDQVNERLTKIMRYSYAQVDAAMKLHKTDMRTAALIIGVKRVADATIRRGIFP